MSSEKIIGKGITRRDFFKGSAAAAAGITAATMLPDSLVYAQSTDRTGCAASSWEKPAKAIAASEIKSTVNADIVIIGAGLAGFSAAIAAKEAGANPVIIEKNKVYAYRGGHITGFGTKVQKEQNITADYAQILRELFRWGQGRVNETLVSDYARKNGACIDWMTDIVRSKGCEVGLWDGYFKGPDYTEYPVTHIVIDKKTGERGNGPLLRAFSEKAKDLGIKVYYSTPAVQLIRKDKKGAVTGVMAGKPGNYTQFNAPKGVIIATGDYASNTEMKKRYSPISAKADSQIYFPNKCNTGDGHAMAMQAGGAMQKVEPHAAVIHLESGAMSYGFLHVNAYGKRFKNEDVNTQSKSCGKLFQPKGGIAWTIYDADGLSQVKSVMDAGKGGGLFFGQMFQLTGEEWNLEDEKKLLAQNIKDNKVVVANSIEELAQKMNVPVETFKKTVARYNEMARNKKDTEYGKRADLLFPIEKAPFYAGKLLATLLTMSGGLSTDERLLVLDANDEPVPNLYVVGAAQGDFFAGDYPTICPGIGHGRCITHGRMAGIIAAGKSTDIIPSLTI